jgi:uncharacterized membrane protein YbhN (UPF0104 family)
VNDLVDAIGSFIDHLAAVRWEPLGVAVLLHLAKVVARTRAWRNIVAAAYPDAVVRWRDVLGAYVAGVGVNAILPARGGDALKLYLVHRRVEGATYPTLAATLLVETLFDAVVATALLVWALQRGVLPGLDVLPTLPSVDWLWLFQRPRLAAAVGGLLLVVAVALGIVAARRIQRFWRRVALGFAILRPPRRYLREVVPWQALSWALRLAAVFFFLRAFGIDATAANTLLVQVTESLSTVLPLTPAGIGTEQALLVYVLRDSTSATAVLSFSVGMKLVLIAVNVAAATLAIAVVLRTLQWRRAVEAGT